MFERKDNVQRDPLVSHGPGSEDLGSSMTSLVSSLLAARAAELRSAELALEVELLQRKLDLHRRYSSTLNAAVEQALLALCRLPQLSDSSEDIDLSGTGASKRTYDASDAEPPTRSKGQQWTPSQRESARFTSGSNVRKATGNSGEVGTSGSDGAEATAASTLKEASEVLSKAQESARQILERALAQGAEIVAKAEAHSRLIDEKVTQVEAVSARSGSTIYQKALELARARGQGRDDDGEDRKEDQIRADVRPEISQHTRNEQDSEDSPHAENASLLGETARTARSQVEEWLSPSDGHALTTVSISPLKSLAPVVALEKAVRAIDGVSQARVLGFRGGLLEMAVEHDPHLSLEEALQGLEGFQMRVVGSTDARLSLELLDSAARKDLW